MKTGYYISKSAKLEQLFEKYLRGVENLLIQKYGDGKTKSVFQCARSYYPLIIQHMPYFDSTMYDQLIVTCAKMLVLKKGLNENGTGVEEFVGLMIEHLRETRSKVPKTFRNIGGKVFLSKLMRRYLKRVASRVTLSGWPTEVFSGSRQDEFEMKICTRECQMVRFIAAVGEEDLTPYCSFADFANAESLGYGLKQTSTIDSGVCTFCFNKTGKVYWPERLKRLAE